MPKWFAQSVTRATPESDLTAATTLRHQLVSRTCPSCLAQKIPDSPTQIHLVGAGLAPPGFNPGNPPPPSHKMPSQAERENFIKQWVKDLLENREDLRRSRTDASVSKRAYVLLLFD